MNIGTGQISIGGNATNTGSVINNFIRKRSIEEGNQAEKENHTEGNVQVPPVASIDKNVNSKRSQYLHY
jgi:hypothetical protein